MTFIFLLMFAALLLINYLKDKTLLAPATLFTAVWIFNYIGLFALGWYLYPISFKTHSIYLIGALSLSAGSAFGNLKLRNVPVKIYRVSNASRHITHIFLDFMLIILILALPAYISSILNMVNSTGWSDFLYASRNVSVNQADRRPLDILANLNVLATLVAMAMFYEADASRTRKIKMYISVLIAILYSLLTGSKGIIVTLPLTLMFISFIKSREINLKILFFILTISFTGFIVLLLLVDYQAQYFDISGLTKAVEGIIGYWVAGLVAFDSVITNPTMYEATQSITRFFYETANALGAQYYVPSLHAAYTNYTQDYNTNTYTIYFSYYLDFGIIGVISIMAGLGLFLQYVYNQSIRGKIIATYFYAMFACAIILSFHGEHFFLSLNEYTKSFIFLSSIYIFPNFLQSIKLNHQHHYKHV